MAPVFRLVRRRVPVDVPRAHVRAPGYQGLEGGEEGAQGRREGGREGGREGR